MGAAAVVAARQPDVGGILAAAAVAVAVAASAAVTAAQKHDIGVAFSAPARRWRKHGGGTAVAAASAAVAAARSVATQIVTRQSTKRAVYGKIFFQPNIIHLTFIESPIHHHRFPTQIQIQDSLTHCIPGIWQDHIPFQIDMHTSREIFVSLSYLFPCLL